MTSVKTVCFLFSFFVLCRGAMLKWSLSPRGNHQNTSTFNFREVAESRIQSLRNLRNRITATEAGNFSHFTNSSKSHNGLALQIKPKEESTGMSSFMKNLETFLHFTKPLKKMMSTKHGIESLAAMIMPKNDVLKRLLKIKGTLEPTLKRYLTDKFNGFLTSLVPYSDNIGVPPFILNSMKIPQDFDPRWQLINSLLNSNEGVEKFLHSLINGKTIKVRPEGVESRSGDETDLISDQEPDATGQAYRRQQQQQLYLNSFKKRLMMPGGGRLRLVSGTRPGADYDSLPMMDQNGQYGHMSYEVSMPEGVDGESYYGGSGMNDNMDMPMSASGGRGHGHHGHSHSQASYGGFLDPFTILGGLAFLTYLGLMLQNSLNRNGTAVGRSSSWDNRLPVIPINLKPVHNNFEITSFSHHRTQRDLSAPGSPSSLTVDQVVQDVNEMWKQLNVLSKRESPSDQLSTCERYKICMLAFKLKDMNLEFLFDTTKFFDAFGGTTNMIWPQPGSRLKLKSLCHFSTLKGCKSKTN